MGESFYSNSAMAAMSSKTFARFSSFIQAELGIKMPEAKMTMLKSRLSKRIRKLGLRSFDEYYDFVFSAKGIISELSNMIDAITTNKTDFFREPKHFDYLSKTALPELLALKNVGFNGKVTAWSAGCSTGEEPYTLAMVLSEFTGKHPGVRFSIMASDISKEVLRKAMLGIYSESEVNPIPMEFRKKYLLKGRNNEKGKVKIVPELRYSVTFRRLNFLDKDYGIKNRMDIIFCRNVIIYFNRDTQEKVLKHLCQYLNPGGYMFLGHSETLNGFKIPLVQVAPTVYRKVP